MLQMPPIQRREIERLKGTRAIRIERTPTVQRVEREPPEPVLPERRMTVDRRQRDEPVANDRRRSRGRRIPRTPPNAKIRALLDNTEARQAPTQGRFIDENV